MSRTTNTPPPLPSPVSGPPGDSGAGPVGAVPQPSATVSHDHTLKWVLSDHLDLGETPPPVTEPVVTHPTSAIEEVEPEALPPPEESPPVNPSTEPAPTPPGEAGTPGTPTLDSPTPGSVTAAIGKSLDSPAEVLAPVAQLKTPVLDTRYFGATPSDFFTLDPTVPPPAPPSLGPDMGATPVAPGEGSLAEGEAELSADSLELLASAADEGSTASQPVSEGGATKVEEQRSVTDAAVDRQAQGVEAREVDPEVLMVMADSSEQTLETDAPPAKTAIPGTTPPPVPVTGSQRLPTADKAQSRGTSPKASDALGQAPEKQSAMQARKATAPSGTAPSRSSAEAMPTPATPTPASPMMAATLFDEYQTPSSGEDALPEALARRSLQKRTKPWYEEVFDDDYLRTAPFMTREQTAREVDFIRDALAVRTNGEVLDVACGYGRHAIELAQQGLRVTGLDLSLPLLIKAADHAQKRGLSVNFVHADMRKMTFTTQFDAAYCVLSSFGYFDEETNLRVATAICRALKPGGRFLLDIINRDYIVGGLPSRVWWEGDGCVVLEEVDFNYHTSRVLIRRSVVFGDGRQSEQELSMRAYSLHEVGRLLRQAGLRVLEVSGGLATKSKFFGSASRNIIAVCERPGS